MSTVHRTLDGSWAECADTACDLKFHLTDIGFAEVKALPQAMLLPLLNAMDNPDAHLPDGTALWYRHTGRRFGNLLEIHRDYDLPAKIEADGTMCWYQHGRIHRGGDKPALIGADGTQMWYDNGARHREHGPALIKGDWVAYYRDNVQVDIHGEVLIGERRLSH